MSEGRKGSTGKALFMVVLFAAGPPLVGILVQKYLSGPDAFRTLGMRGSLTVKRAADAQVALWSRVSALAATSYQRSRL
jgi:hypothetical protein